MARPEKVAQVEEIAEGFERSTATLLTEYRGLSVGELADLRRRLRAEDAEYKVVKNTLTRRAVRKAGVDVPDEVLTGPTAVTFCNGDPVAAAKVLKAFQKEHPELAIKAGIMEGALLDAAEAARLADLASREELLGQLAGMLGTLLAQPARLAKANLDKVARLLGAYQDKLPADGAAATEAEPAAEAGDAEPAAEADDSEEPAAEADDAEAGDAEEAAADDAAADDDAEADDAEDGDAEDGDAEDGDEAKS